VYMHEPELDGGKLSIMLTYEYFGYSVYSASAKVKETSTIYSTKNTVLWGCKFKCLNRM
jgi:hypothetical protein